MQVNELTIEVLPKADRSSTPDRQLWHNVLLDMLQYCRWLKVELLGHARLHWQRYSLLEIYYEIFLAAVEQLLRSGLLRTYKRQQGQSRVCKGRLLLSKHLQYNGLRPEQFYVDYQTYDHQHLLNQILYTALLQLGTLSQRADLNAKQRQLLSVFPIQKVRRFSVEDFDQLRYDSRSSHYQTAVEIAQLLLLGHHPDVRAGERSLITMMFDMNLLFEEYVYRQLRKLNYPTIQVHRQQLVPFWGKRTLRPDIVLTYQDKRYVIDTKWKILQRIHPNMEDIRQMYVYNRFFEAHKGVLLYPNVHDIAASDSIPYKDSNNIKTYCKVAFANVLQGDRLNLKLGEQIWTALHQK